MVQVRAATVDDAEAVAGLITELGYPVEPGAMRARLAAIFAATGYTGLVAEGTDGVVGFIGAGLQLYFEHDGPHCRLLVLVVAAAARGQGIGGRLVEAVERWAAAHGARTILVTSALHRDAAHRFYEDRGYARTGFRFVKPLP